MSGSTGTFLYRSALEAKKIYDSMDQAGCRIMSRSLTYDWNAAYLAHCTLFQRGCGACVPKHHFCLHMGRKIPINGSPLYCSTYPDESLNGVIAAVARTSHRLTFASTVFAKWRYLHRGYGQAEHE